MKKKIILFTFSVSIAALAYQLIDNYSVFIGVFLMLYANNISQSN